jgi:hypothetical protein
MVFALVFLCVYVVGALNGVEPWRIGIKSFNFVKLSPLFHFIIFLRKVMFSFQFYFFML